MIFTARQSYVYGTLFSFCREGRRVAQGKITHQAWPKSHRHDQWQSRNNNRLFSLTISRGRVNQLRLKSRRYLCSVASAEHTILSICEPNSKNTHTQHAGKIGHYDRFKIKPIHDSINCYSNCIKLTQSHMLYTTAAHCLCQRCIPSGWMLSPEVKDRILGL